MKSNLSVIVFSRSLDRYSVAFLQQLGLNGHKVYVVIEPLAGAGARDWSSEVSIIDYVRLDGRFDTNAAKRYKEHVRSTNADICLCYTSRALSIALLAKRKYKFKAPIVGTRGAIGGLSAWYIQDWFSYLSPKLNAVVCMSNAIRRKLAFEAYRFFPSHPGIFRTIYPGYQQLTSGKELFQKNRSKIEVARLLCIANDRPIKGLALLLRSIDENLQSTNWALDVVGNCGEKIQAMVSQSPKLRQHVRLHGFQKNVQPFFDQAHIYIQPTLAPGEGIGNSIAEAMANALPVITSDMGGGVELVMHEKTGLHFKTGCAESLSKSIERLISDPELCKQLGSSGNTRLNEVFGIDREVEAFTKLFYELLSP